MKILIVSDSHRKDDLLKQVIEAQAPLDVLIHLGDAEGSEERIASWVNSGCQLHMVLGNNDFFSVLDREQEIQLGSHRALLTHGHYYNVTLGPEILCGEALDRSCDIAMYGHTHRPFLEHMSGVTILNPGSISYPRQEGRKPSYMIMTLDEAGIPSYETCYLD